MPEIASGGEQSSLPSEVTEKFDEVFNNISPSDLAEAGENTNAHEPSVREPTPQEVKASQRRRQQEQTQELHEGGEQPLEGEEPATEGTEPQEAAVEEAGEKTPAGESQQADPLASIDPNHIFAAQQLGWTPEKLAKLAAADPELAAETAANLAETYNNLSRQMLMPIGPQGFAPVTQPQQTPAQSPTPKLDKFYTQLEQFTQANGQDLGEFVTALREEMMNPVRQLMADAEASREQARKTEAVTTMKSLSDKFGDFYGQQEAAFTPAQQQARGNLAMVADQLRSGARAQGRDLSITEAINRAHLIVANQFQRSVVRTEIKQQLQKREKSITAKPTQRRDTITAGGRSKASAEQAISRFWADKGIDADLD